ncbi:MAG: hypothetical protein ABSD11_17465 [Methylocella sp.]|jgi:hypothetical protein
MIERLALMAGISPGDTVIIFADEVTGIVFEVPPGIDRVFQLLDIHGLPRDVTVVDLFTDIVRGAATLH